MSKPFAQPNPRSKRLTNSFQRAYARADKAKTKPVIDPDAQKNRNRARRLRQRIRRVGYTNVITSPRGMRWWTDVGYGDKLCYALIYSPRQKRRMKNRAHRERKAFALRAPAVPTVAP